MRLYSISLAAAAVTLSLAVDCELRDPVSPTDGMLRTGATEYVVRQENGLLRTEIGLTFVNRTGGAVYIPSCHGPYPPVLEKVVDGQWVIAYAPIVLLCLEQPVAIAPGKSYDFAYRVHAALPGTNAGPQFSVTPIAGTYRAVWGLFSEKLADGTTTKPLAAESRTSNTFQLREP